jgi:transcriptional regulator with XRE-family HTH domain
MVSEIRELPTIRGVKNPTNEDVLGEINAEIARQKGLTAKEVAERAGIEYQTFLRIRMNQRVLTFPEVAAIFDALGVPLEVALRMINERKARGL